jgi:hypothetical protein
MGMVCVCGENMDDRYQSLRTTRQLASIGR